MSGTPAQKFKCGVCLEEETGKPHVIDNNPVCADCVSTQIVPLFQNALQFEHGFPPKWGNVELQVRDFAYVLDPIDPTFVGRYEQIAQDYATPYDIRIYCPHKIEAARAPPKGTAAKPGDNVAMSRLRIETLNAEGVPITDCGHIIAFTQERLKILSTCYHCGGVVCDCGAALEHAHDPHTCTEQGAEDTLEADGLVRGKDFQFCPSCGIRISLNDGCNAMDCTFCSAQFCYLCGEPHGHDDGHWNLGGTCPRWGPADSGMFDDPNAVADDDVDENDEQALVWWLARSMIEELANRLREREDHNPNADDEAWRNMAEDEIRAMHGEATLDRVRATIPLVEAQMHAEDQFNEVRQETEALEAEHQHANADTRDFLHLLRHLPLNLRQMMTILTTALDNPEQWPVDNVVTNFAARYVQWAETMGDIEERGFMDRTPRLQEYWNDVTEDLPQNVRDAITAEVEQRQENQA